MRIPLVACAVALAAPAGVPGGAPADAWPQFRGEPELHGRSAQPLPERLKLVWSREAGGSIESSAALGDGVAYVGTGAGDLLAVDLATGAPRWTYRTEAAEGIGESSPALAGDAVFVGDLAGVVHAVDARTGRRLWTFKTEGEVKASPVVTQGKVLIGSYDGHLYALDARSGA